MGIDKDSNKFTFTFAAVMVVVVGTLLAVIALGLKPLQDANDRDRKMMDILAAIRVDATRSNAQELFDKYLKEKKVIDKDGKTYNEVDAFDVDVRGQYRNKQLADGERRYPLYVCNKDGKDYVVLPVVGNGLWGPIWGYVSLEDNYNTIYGAAFDHKGETPGLGAEIREKSFQKQFEGKEIMENGKFVSVYARKGGALPGNTHQVDAITGGTITSNGVSEMLERNLFIYSSYLKK